MRKLTLYIIFSLFLVLNCKAQQNKEKMQLLNFQKEYVAYQKISLVFNKTSDNIPNIYISNSYGNIIITPNINTQNITYNIPEHISQKSGWVFWQLTNKQQNTEGEFYIHPIKNAKKIETYLGPPSIEAGNIEHAMLVTIPLDKYNNPMPKNTAVLVKENHLNNRKSDTVYFDGMIAHKLINSKPKSGRTFVSSECLNKTSKEYTLEITPSSPIGFNIYFKRSHDYADGNQITKFHTTIIKDKYNNIVSDGTFVTFRIKNSNGVYLQTYGTTINGVATAQMIHPDYEDKWNVTAFIDGFSESNSIILKYKRVIKDYHIKYNNKNKTISLGPFKSFMNQTLPDGLIVKLELFENGNSFQKMNTQTENGYVIFELESFIKNNKNYTINIEAAKINKQLDLN